MKHQESKGPHKLPRMPPIVRVLRAVKRRYYARKRSVQKDHKTNEWMMARWTRNVGLFTLALVVVGIVTAVIFKNQLDVMQNQLDEMKIASGISDKTLIATQRPWVTVELNIVGPLTYGDEGITIPVRADMRNTGKSPALNAFVIWRADSTVGTVKVLNHFHDLCDNARRFKRRTGYILFPGDEQSDEGSLRIAQDDLAKNVSGDGYYSVTVYGCVDYLSTLDSLHHQTGFMLDLVPRQLIGPKKLYALITSIPVMQPSELALTILVGGFYAD